MYNSLNKKLAEILGKVDDKMLQAKLNAALDILKRGDTEELVKKINKMDKNELLEKLNEIDDSKLQELKIDKNEIRAKVSEADLEKLKNMLGERGDEIVRKIKDIIK